MRRCAVRCAVVRCSVRCGWQSSPGRPASNGPSLTAECPAATCAAQRGGSEPLHSAVQVIRAIMLEDSQYLLHGLECGGVLTAAAAFAAKFSGVRWASSRLIRLMFAYSRKAYLQPQGPIPGAVHSAAPPPALAGIAIGKERGCRQINQQWGAVALTRGWVVRTRPTAARRAPRQGGRRPAGRLPCRGCP